MKTVAPNEIVVTGASGLLGFEFACRLARTGAWKVRAVSRSTLPWHGLNNLESYQSDTLFDAAWIKDLPPQTPVIHCAGLSNPRAAFSGLAEVLRDQTVPHLEMVETMCAIGWQGRLIFPSSGGAIYGEATELPIPETHPLNPKSLYGVHKLCLERGLGDLATRHGFELANLRISNPYGVARAKAGQGVIAILIAALYSGQIFEMIGDGTSERDYIHIDDLWAAIEQSITAPFGAPIPDNQITLNIGSGHGVSLNEVIDRLEILTGRRLNMLRKPSLYDVKSNVLDCRAAASVLGWCAGISFDQGSEIVIEKHKDKRC